MDVCTPITPYDSNSLYTDIDSANNRYITLGAHFTNNGVAVIIRVWIMHVPCVLENKIMWYDTILTWLFTDLGFDYSIGSFIEQVGGLTDEGFETDCFEIVDNTTEVTDSTIHVVHSTIIQTLEAWRL